MTSNYVKWLTPAQLPHVEWTPKTEQISRYALSVPCDLADRTGTCDLYVTEDAQGRETGSVVDIRLPYKHQDEAPGAFSFQLTETPPAGQETAIPEGLFIPVDLRKLVNQMVLTNGANLDAEGIDLSDFDSLFPDLQVAASED